MCLPVLLMASDLISSRAHGVDERTLGVQFRLMVIVFSDLFLHFLYLFPF